MGELKKYAIAVSSYGEEITLEQIFAPDEYSALSIFARKFFGNEAFAVENEEEGQSNSEEFPEDLGSLKEFFENQDQTVAILEIKE